jgi:hypothetical protein
MPQSFIFRVFLLGFIFCVSACATPNNDPRRVKEDPRGGYVYYFEPTREFQTQDGCCMAKDNEQMDNVRQALVQHGLVPAACTHGIEITHIGYSEGWKGHALFKCAEGN